MSTNVYSFKIEKYCTNTMSPSVLNSLEAESFSSKIQKYYQPKEISECWFMYLEYLNSNGPIFKLKNKTSTMEFMHWWRWFQALLTTFHIDVATMLILQWHNDILNLESEKELIIRDLITRSIVFKRSNLYSLTAQEVLWSVFEECGFIIDEKDMIVPFKFSIAFESTLGKNLENWYKMKLMHNIAGAAVNEEDVCNQIREEHRYSPYGVVIDGYFTDTIKKRNVASLLKFVFKIKTKPETKSEFKTLLFIRVVRKVLCM